MLTNKKKPLVLKNRTNYFVPTKDKVKVRFGSPYTYQSRQSKIEGIETRLYYQFKWCEDNAGQTFFYTLTYNDAAMPKYNKINCFDYEDLRDLLTGGFRKQLLRKYGTTFKYFVGAELGDGKGSRGMHNNPHYHILFFLEPAHNEKFPYIPIEPSKFRHLVRLYWQGFDEDEVGYRDYNLAKYGIAKEGDNCGKVMDFRACTYCAKYVCKDVKLVQYEDQVERFLRFKHLSSYKDSEESYKDYFYNRIYDMYNTPLNAKRTKWSFDDLDLILQLAPGYLMFPLAIFYPNINSFKPIVKEIIKRNSLFEDYCSFVNQQIEPKVKEGINEYRNRYCNKFRISHGVGEYALKGIDRLSPTIQVPSKNGFKNRPIGMYYYRKLYTDVVKDKLTGQNIYVLNQAGIDYKVNKLATRLSKIGINALNNFHIILDNKELFEKMQQSDINTSVLCSYSDFKRCVSRLLAKDSLNEIIKRYAEYKLIYEDRFFSLNGCGDSNVSGFPPICPYADYRRFLQPSYYMISRDDMRLTMFLENTPEDFLPYYSHPYFLRYHGVFSVLDMCADYFFIQADDKAQREAEQRAALKRFHSERALKDFYSHFRN